jgi:hypothetical protein
MKQAFIIWAIATSVMAQLDPTDPNNQSTNSTPQIGSYTEQQMEHGAIITAKMTGEVIEWWNLRNGYFDVEHRARLTDGGWVNVGSGYKQFEHNNPDGFYRVIQRESVGVFPVWNAGTTDMVWSASTECNWIELELVNTNIPPEWGEGYILAELVDTPTNGAEGVITVFTVGALSNQTKQCTIIYTGD